MNTAKTIYGEVQAGDWVVSAPSNDYGLLIGMVTAIEKFGTSEHKTGNETDDVHVDFTVFEYPTERISEIEEHFSDLFGETKSFEELPLDDVIMAPKMLIRISHLEHDEITRMGNLRQNCEAFCNCFPGANMPNDSKYGELMERIEKNLIDYHDSLMGFGKRELIDMAGKITAMSDAHLYVTSMHDFNEDEMQFYLQFQCPLEVIADEWNDRSTNIDGVGDVISYLSDNKDVLDDYPLMSDSDVLADNSLHRFMSVNLIDFLGKIVEKTIIHYPNDWQIDKGRDSVT